MVFSVVRNFVSSLLFSNDDDDDSNEESEENEEELLRKITSDDEIPVVPSPNTNDLNSELKSSDNAGTLQYKKKQGKITYLCPEYGLIDKEYYFESKVIPENLMLKVDDMVYYHACKLGENQTEKVLNILCLCDSTWDGDGKCDEIRNVPDVVPTERLEYQMINRVINGQVVERREREVFIKPSNIWVDLDKVATKFVPIEGDWVKLKAKVTVDEEVTDLTGEVIEIKVIEELRKKCDSGQVTLWHQPNRGEGEGAINKEIYFTQECCESGYIPSLGDEVIFEAIESTQGEHTWRATSVIPMEVSIGKSGQDNCTELDKLLRDKNNVGIIGLLDFGEVRFNETKELVLEVKNFHKTRSQELIRTRFHTRKQNSQIKLKSPGLDDKFTIPPEGSVRYVFECKGKFVGSSTELFVFYFKNFKIGRNLEMNITMDKAMNKLMPCDVRTHYRRSFHAISHQNFNKTFGNDRTRTLGAKPKSAPKFIRGEKPGRYKVPEKLMNIILNNGGMPRRHNDLVNEITNYAGFLEGEICPTNYNDWFHLLLYVEEAAVRISLRRFDMEGVILKNKGEYLTLEVPGLQEQRPSLIVGDKVVVTQPWSEKSDTEHAGFIYEIRQKEVLLKFHPSFHDEYDESDCNVYFENNMSNLQKGHDAVNRAMKKLGSRWLFPSSVQEKSCQIIFESIEDFDENSIKPPQKNEQGEITPSVNEFFKTVNDKKNDSLLNLDLENILHEKNIEVEYDVDEEGLLVPRKPPMTDLKTIERKTKSEPKNIENPMDKAFELKKRKLVWFNKSLNYHQKASVVNVLKGQGRPLPFIIFGPPGTGKTITLVETILQIYTLIPESRIIIGTPSNSSADLICERIIDSGVLEPGELVRIMAYHRVCEGNIPEKLIPYCTTTDMRDDKGNPEMHDAGDRLLKQSSLSQLLGRHRITVGTCSALGSMHYMGFPPNHFTHILIDEAGQAMEPEILIPITFLNPLSGQVVLAGDPEQLGPTCISKVAEEFGLGQSLLHRFVKCFPYTRDHAGFPNTNGYDPRFITRLCINYRSLPEILNLPSKLFYNAELIPNVSPNDSIEFEIIEKFHKEIDLAKDSPPAMIFHGVRGQNLQEGDCPSWFNVQEIWQCLIYLRKCYSIGLKADDCGIITPYKKQVQKLRQLLTELETPVPKIGTVEDFQGQERYAIILSPVRSTLSYVGNDIKHSLGFIASPRRLNVGLTRARALLIIVGNPHVLSADPYWRSALLYCVDNDSYLGCDLPPNLDEFLENKNETNES